MAMITAALKILLDSTISVIINLVSLHIRKLHLLISAETRPQTGPGGLPISHSGLGALLMSTGCGETCIDWYITLLHYRLSSDSSFSVHLYSKSNLFKSKSILPKSPNMSSFQASELFSVKGRIAVVTGGGSGKSTVQCSK